MKFPVDFPQPAAGDVSVDFRRADVRVAEQFLNHPQVRTVLQQVRRETVPQHVRRDVALDARAANAILDAQPQRDGSERRAAFVEKNIRR